MLLKPTFINSDSGLPNEQVHTLRQDAFGKLWLASPAGLICYNGSNISVFDTSSGLSCQGLRTIAISKEGLVWIGTDRGLETIDLHGNVQPLLLNFEWIYGIAECILITGDEVWVGTSFGLLIMKKHGGAYDLELEADLGLIRDINKLSDSKNLVVSAKYGLVVFKGKDWKLFNEELPSGDAVLCVTKTIDNFYLAGTKKGLYILTAEGELKENFFLNDERKKVDSIVTVGDEWWVAFSQTLVLLNPGTYGLKVVESVRLPSRINKLFADSFNNIWIATNNSGLGKITCLRQIMEHIDCRISAPVFCVKDGPNPNEYLITGDGFCSLLKQENISDDHDCKLIAEFPSIVWNACLDPVDPSRIWYATQDGLYNSVGGGKPERFIETGEILDSPNRVLLTRDDEIWLGTISGLYRIKDNIVEEILNAQGHQFGYVYCLCLQIDNSVWVGTLGQGLWQESPEGFIQIASNPLSKLGNTYSIVANPEGETLVVQENNVVIIDKDHNPRLVFQELPMAGWTSDWVDSHTVAVGSNFGVIVIDILNSKAIHRISPHLGKSGWQFTATNSLKVGPGGKLFCGINGGLYLFDYNKINLFDTPPVARLDKIIWRNVDPENEKGTYNLPAGKWALNASVYSALFIDEKSIRYRFKLIGFDQEWTDYSSQTSVSYNSLPPGSYELAVQAYTPLTGEGEPASILKIRVSIPFWSSWIQPVVTSLVSFYKVMFRSGVRNKELLEKNAEMQQEIKERKLAESALQNYKTQLENIVANRTKALQIEKDKAETADKMKSEFLANMSHEIRTPISGVIGLNNILADTELDETQKDYVTKINYSANHLLQILNDILDINKIEAGMMELEKIPFSIKEMVRDIETFGKIKALDSKIDLVFDLNTQTNAQLIGDPLRLKQILLNLLSNAMKFTHEGSVNVRIKEINTIQDEVVLRFSVSDTGIGMTEKQMKKLFTAFQQADTSTSRMYGGTGLGLNISYKFVEMMDSKLQVESEEGKGTTFFFTLQMKKAETKEKELTGTLTKGTSVHQSEIGSSDKIMTVKKQAKPGTPEGFEKVKGSKILVAEDNEINQLVIRKLLTNDGFDVRIVPNGKECVRIFSESPDYDLILMDIQMPEMDGLEATGYIRNVLRNWDIKIIALTAHVMEGTKEKIINNGMNDYLAKPLKREDLLKMCMKWIS